MSENLKTHCDLLVIGAGPAGLSTAAECIYHELGTTIVLEKGESHNQAIRIYYPESKRVDAEYKGQEAICAGLFCFRETTKPIFLEAMEQLIELHHVLIETNAGVDSIKKNEDGTFTVSGGDQSYIARDVVIAVGRMGKPNRPPYYKQINSTTRRSVHFDLSKLRNDSKDILIVGGGNTAVEYALSLTQKYQVSLSYRKMEFARLNEMNHKMLLKDEEEGRLRVLRGSNIEGITSVENKVRVRYDDDQSEDFDQIVFGIGGSSPGAFLASTGMVLDKKSNPILDEWLMSSVEGLYVAGELSVPPGKGSIISSFNTGKTIVEGIMKKRGLGRMPEVVSLPPQPPHG